MKQKSKTRKKILVDQLVDHSTEYKIDTAKNPESSIGCTVWRSLQEKIRSQAWLNNLKFLDKLSRFVPIPYSCKLFIGILHIFSPFFFIVFCLNSSLMYIISSRQVHNSLSQINRNSFFIFSLMVSEPLLKSSRIFYLFYFIFKVVFITRVARGQCLKLLDYQKNSSKPQISLKSVGMYLQILDATKINMPFKTYSTMRNNQQSYLKFESSQISFPIDEEQSQRFRDFQAMALPWILTMEKGKLLSRGMKPRVFSTTL